MIFDSDCDGRHRHRSHPRTAGAPMPDASPLVVAMGVSGSGQVHRRRRPGPAAPGAVRGRRRLPPAGQHRQDDRRRGPRRRRPAPLARGDRGVAREAHSEGGGVMSCSALKRQATATSCASHTPDVEFLHLHGTREVIARRQASRPGHFMPASLLDSQFATLEPLAPDERGRRRSTSTRASTRSSRPTSTSTPSRAADDRSTHVPRTPRRRSTARRTRRRRVAAGGRRTAGHRPDRGADHLAPRCTRSSR